MSNPPARQIAEVAVRLTLLALLFLTLAVVSCGKDKLIPPKRLVIGHNIVFYGKALSDTSHTHLFVVNANGTGFYQITSDTLDDSDPRWSPDGTKIAIIRWFVLHDSANVAVVAADGRNLVRLTHDDCDANPSWSADGMQIAYQHGPATVFPPIFDVWVMDANGANPHLYMNADSTNTCWDVEWTPKGTLLGSTFSDVWMQLTQTATSLTRIGGFQVMQPGGARLAPDSTRIAYTWLGYTSTEPPQVCTINVNGSGFASLTQGGGPVWSPDSKKIAFVRDGRLWTMSATGANQVPLTDNRTVRVFGVGSWK